MRRADELDRTVGALLHSGHVGSQLRSGFFLVTEAVGRELDCSDEVAIEFVCDVFEAVDPAAPARYALEQAGLALNPLRAHLAAVVAERGAERDELEEQRLRVVTRAENARRARPEWAA